MDEILYGHGVAQAIGLLLIGVISVARMARLLTFDDFPPVEVARQWAYNRLPSSWSKLVTCPFCLAPYLMAVQIAWFAVAYHQGGTSSWFVWGWLVPNMWWALSYVAAIVVAYDMPEE